MNEPSQLPQGSTLVSIIAAVARNGVIGRDNQLAWHLPEDLKHFKALTLGHPVIMGRKTYDSIGRPLPGRRNLVISRNPAWHAEGCETFASLDAALAACSNAKEVFVIGGAQIYALALPLADRLYLTEVDLDAEGDAYFPEFDRSAWQEKERRENPALENRPAFAFVTYERKGR